MRGYEDYEDLDEYETEGDEYEDEEGGEEQEQEEVRQPTREELEYLELRKKLKERVRKKLKKDSSSSLANGRDKKNKLPYDNYGSFFGPSQPVIAQRVIQESKSLLENPHLAARVSKSNNGSSKTVTSAPGGSRPQANNNHHRPQKVPEVIRAKSKAQILKNTRDYSFLLADDQDLPTQTKAPPPRNISVSRTEASHSAQVQHKSKNPLISSSSSSIRKVDNGREERRPVPKTNQSTQPRAGPHRPGSSSKPSSTSVDPRRQSTHNGSGPGRPSLTSSRHPVTSSRHPVTSSRPPVTSSRPPVTSRPTAQTSRPLLPKSQPSKKPMEQRASVPVQRNSSVPSVRKPLPSNSQASGSKKPLDRRREFHDSGKGKIMSKQPASSSRPQMKQPVASNPARAPLQENRPKKRPARPFADEDDDGADISSVIRNMFGYNPNKYRDDDDVSDMEAGFDDIVREEKRSARIARKEDEEELRKIEEEERKERMRKEAKKRKLK